MIIIEKDKYIVKARINPEIYKMLKDILNHKGETIQNVLDYKIREFILENIDLILAKVNINNSK